MRRNKMKTTGADEVFIYGSCSYSYRFRFESLLFHAEIM